MGRRVDAVLLLGGTALVIEFKVGAEEHRPADVEQCWDYALDLKNFHDRSHGMDLVPVLAATCAEGRGRSYERSGDGVYRPVLSNGGDLHLIAEEAAGAGAGGPDPAEWEASRYAPRPSIVAAARDLYRRHGVREIAAAEAGEGDLRAATGKIREVISGSREDGAKSICLVTGVPGAGKTLAGLNIAHEARGGEGGSVFLSANVPLVRVLREALSRDRAGRGDAAIGEARRQTRAVIQDLHHFMGEGGGPAFERVLVFDEAQRAWNRKKAEAFGRQSGAEGPYLSEPEAIIRKLDAHDDWGAMVCLIGGGQEIHDGEAGVGEWLRALRDLPSKWRVHVSPEVRELTAGEDDLDGILEELGAEPSGELHLGTSARSFRGEGLSLVVEALLAGDQGLARARYGGLRGRYPIALTRDLAAARGWLRRARRGTERIGLVASSRGRRLLPEGIHVDNRFDAPSWFLNGSGDIRSSHYLEKVATEFEIQGLELDWACLAWDADFYMGGGGWEYRDFAGTSWHRVRGRRRRDYVRNAYRVLLTRARQGMVLFVPRGDPGDPTRDPRLYDQTYEYLAGAGLEEA